MALRDKARWDNEIGDFLEACWDRARLESEIADFLEIFRFRARWETCDKRLPSGL